MLVDDQPLAVLILPNCGPAEVAHLNLARFVVISSFTVAVAQTKSPWG